MFKVDFIDGKAVKWEKHGSAVSRSEDDDYIPDFYIEAGSESELRRIRPEIAGKQETIYTSIEQHRTGLSSAEKKSVLRVGVRQPGQVRKLAHNLLEDYSRSELRFYNVDISPQFRYCLENQINPAPSDELTTLELDLDEKDIAEGDISGLDWTVRQ